MTLFLQSVSSSYILGGAEAIIDGKHKYNFYLLMIDWPFCHYKEYFFDFSKNLSLKIFHICLAILVLHYLHSHYIVSHPFAFSLLVLVYTKI